MREKLEIDKTIRNRRTIRKYSKKMISAKIINAILSASRFAPSPYNTQPWYFVLMENHDYKRKIVQELRSPTLAVLPSLKPVLENAANIIEGSQLLILVYNQERYSRRIRMLGEPYFSLARLSEVQSIGAAIQNMLLTATKLGVGSAWLTVPVFIKKKISQIVKKEAELMAVLTFGYPRGKPERVSRKRMVDMLERI